MSMGKLANEAIEHTNKLMEAHVNSMCATEDEIYMAAMSCRIIELEKGLRNLLNDCINFDGTKLTDVFMKEATSLLKDT